MAPVTFIIAFTPSEHNHSLNATWTHNAVMGIIITPPTLSIKSNHYVPKADAPAIKAATTKVLMVMIALLL